jgi:ABC-type polysaccharide/polyol phosphate transport system ATPase subunit
MSYELMLPDAVSPETAAVGQAAAGTGEGNDDTVAIRLAGIGKAYPGCARPADRLLQIFLGERHRRYQQFWALHPIDLDVRKGEVLGIVGHNGAGKSTLLQIIAGTMLPSHGSRRVQGRLSALLELGAGFNPEFTGRENVFLAAALLGMTRREIQERFPAIVEFSGLDAFIDQPVRTYSSGMFVRLAFSVAVSVDPDVLIIDEALSVGDGAFARRSFDRIMQFKDQGRTILFCSHSLYQIESLCTQALWLDRGRLQQLGPPADVAAAYQAHLDRLTAGTSSMPASAVVTPLKAAVKTEGHARIKGLALLRNGRRDTEEPVLSDAGSIEIVIDFESDPALETPTAAVTINTTDGRIIASTGTWIDGCPLSRDAAGRGQARVSFTDLPLLKGDYAVSAYLFCERGLYIYSAAEHFDTFSVVQRSLEQGLVSLPHRWSGTPGPADTEEVAMPDEGPLLDLPADWSGQWSVRWTRSADFPALQALFFEAFGKDIGQDLWAWKYRHAPTWGLVVTRDERPIAYFGGMPRVFRQAGQPLLGVQIGDVMVKPAERGTLSRRSPQFRAAAAYFTNMHHLYPDVRFAFGFPHERALRVGLRVGVYAEVDAILALTWSSLPPRRNWRVRTREIGLARGDSETKLIDGLWQAMQHDWPDLLLPERDAAQWIFRYADCPEQRYRVLLLRQRWTRRPLAAVALRAHAGHVEWLDFVGPRANIDAAVEVVRTFAGALGVDGVQGWFSTAAAECFAAKAKTEPTEIRVPVNAVGTEDAGKLPGRLWLMAGDTDFR